MDKSRELFNKLTNGERLLIDDEAELIMKMLLGVKLDEHGNFRLEEEYIADSVAPPPNSCLSCDRPF